MPTYEYECEKCGHRFEFFQSMKDEPKKRCPKCKGKLRRLIGTGAGMIFKGSGFYVTDYRSDSYKSQKSSESNEASKTTPKSDAPKSDAPKSDAAKSDAAKSDAPKSDVPRSDAPKPKTEGKAERDGARKKKSESA